MYMCLYAVQSLLACLSAAVSTPPSEVSCPVTCICIPAVFEEAYPRCPLGGLPPLLQELLLRFAGQVLQGSSHLLLPILRNGRRVVVENDPPILKTPERGM